MHIINRVLFVVVTVSLGACGGGSGSNGNETVDRSPLLINSNDVVVAPLQQVSLQVSRNLEARAFNGNVEVDLTGRGQFSSATAMFLPALTNSGQVVFSAPLLDLSPGLSSGEISVRVRSNDSGQYSNVLRFTVDPIETGEFRRGEPSLLLDLVLLGLFSEMDDRLKTSSYSLKPGLELDAARLLGADSTLIDVQAEAILRQVFGFSTTNNEFDIPVRTLMDEFGSTRVNNAFKNILDCIGSELDSFGSEYQSAGKNCEDVARKEILNNVVGGISDYVGDFATTSMTIVSGLNLGAKPIGNYVRQLVERSQNTKYVAELAELSYYANKNTPSQERADFLEGKITSAGRKKIYQHVTSGLDTTTKDLLNLVGAPDALNSVLDLSEDAVQAIKEMEDGLIDVNTVKEQWVEDENYILGDRELPLPESNSVKTPDFIVTPVGTIPTANAPTPSEICEQYPELQSLPQDLGISSCEQYITPFMDEQYLNSVLIPLVEEMSEKLEAVLAVCTGDITPECETALANSESLSDGLFDSINNYERPDGKTCLSSYRTFATDDPDIDVCVWSSITYSPNGSSCYAGSRRPEFDVGSADVCMYYSRDYFLPDGSCRTNYSSVFFLEKQRCRWSGIPISSDVVYALNKISGEQFTVEQ